MNKKTFLPWLLFLIILEAILIFLFIPALNVLSLKFWFFLVFPALTWFWFAAPSASKIYTIASALLIVFVILFVIFGSIRLISDSDSSKSHSHIAKINNDGIFADSVPEVTSPTTIPTVDRETAIALATSLLNSNQHYFETYMLGAECNLIYYKESYYRIIPLEYIDSLNFGGVPGYILVNIYNGETNFVKLENDNTIKYSPSSILTKDLSRHIWFHYPTELLGDENFEIDDDGHPYYVVPTLKFKSILLGGHYVYGALVVDAVTGNIQKYSLGNIPAWIENVYDINRLMTEVTWHLAHVNGAPNWYTNSTDSKPITRYQTGSEYYLFGKDTEVFVYTGVAIGSSSMNNVSFVLGNLKTGELTYYSDYGISEDNAQNAVQNLFLENQYVPSRVLLLNIEENPVYYLALKNHLDNPELFAFVNKNKPSVFCVTGETVNEALKNYYKMIDKKYPYSIEYDESD